MTSTAKETKLNYLTNEIAFFEGAIRQCNTRLATLSTAPADYNQEDKAIGIKQNKNEIAAHTAQIKTYRAEIARLEK